MSIRVVIVNLELSSQQAALFQEECDVGGFFLLLLFLFSAFVFLHSGIFLGSF